MKNKQIFTCENCTAFPLLFNGSMSGAALSEWRFELECVNVMVLFEEVLSRFEFIFAEVWLRMCHLNVCYLWIQIIHIHLE